jgi:hypothetical protein
LAQCADAALLDSKSGLTDPLGLADNSGMSTKLPIAPPLDDPQLCAADAATVLEHLSSGKPLDPAILARVRTRAQQVTDAIRREHGVVDNDDFQSLLDDEA